MRRRYLSTKISVDTAVNRLATVGDDFAVLLYTWAIPHAEDDGTISADPDEILFTIFPGRRDKTADDIQKAIDAITSLHLMERVGDRLKFPDSFFRFQSYISAERRKSAHNSADERKTPSCSGLSSGSKKKEGAAPPPDVFSSTVEKTVRAINELAGKSYRPDSPTTSKELLARLKGGATEADCLAVVNDRWRRWSSKSDMLEHFNPVTLFRKSNFDKYLVEAQSTNGNGDETPKNIKDLGDGTYDVDGRIYDRRTFESRYGKQHA